MFLSIVINNIVKMKVLITGINGFVGQHLAKFLLSKNIEVYGIGINKSTKLKNIKYIKADVTKKDELLNILKVSKPDMIFHLAAVSSIRLCENNPKLTKKVNEWGTRNLLSACVDLNLKPKILITSSAQVYGISKKRALNEEDIVNPSNEYAISKLKQEKISLSFFKKYNLPIFISRSFNHIGPNQPSGFVCSDFAKQIVEIEKGIKEPEFLVGNLRSKRDFMDVRDIVKAYSLLLEKGKPGEIYNIGSRKVYSIKEILNKLLKKSNVKVKIKKDDTLFRKLEVSILKADNSKFVNITSWKPKINIDKSLQDILDYWRNQIK